MRVTTPNTFSRKYYNPGSTASTTYDISMTDDSGKETRVAAAKPATTKSPQ